MRATFFFRISPRVLHFTGEKYQRCGRKYHKWRMNFRRANMKHFSREYKLRGRFRNYATIIVSAAKFTESYMTLTVITLPFRARVFSFDGKMVGKKRRRCTAWQWRFGPLFVDEKGIFVATRPFMMYRTATLARTFFSGLDLRGSFLHCTKARPVKRGLCQGTPSEGFARRKVMWDRKLRANFHIRAIAIASLVVVSNLE